MTKLEKIKKAIGDSFKGGIEGPCFIYNLDEIAQAVLDALDSEPTE